jgi:hypothetical protein
VHPLAAHRPAGAIAEHRVVPVGGHLAGQPLNVAGRQLADGDLPRFLNGTIRYRSAQCP